MSITAPALLVAGLLVVAALAAAAVVLARRRAAALAAAGVAAQASRRLPPGVWCTVASLVLLAFAASGPSVWVPVPRAAGTVVLAMDVSGSMGADDVTPSRLAAAQQAARSFIAAQPDTVDIGVVAFERGALTTALPDADHTVALAAVDRLVVTGGTSLGQAILASLSAITGRPVVLDDGAPALDLGYWPSATIVIFSDGEDRGGGADPAAAAEIAQAAGVHVDTVGVGTTTGTTVDVDGFRMHTALDPDTLGAIAQTSGGTYHAASDTAELEGIASTIDLRLTVADQELPLAGALSAVALGLLAVGAGLTVVRSGRVI